MARMGSTRAMDRSSPDLFPVECQRVLLLQDGSIHCRKVIPIPHDWEQEKFHRNSIPILLRNRTGPCWIHPLKYLPATIRYQLRIWRKVSRLDRVPLMKEIPNGLHESFPIPLPAANLTRPSCHPRLCDHPSSCNGLFHRSEEARCPGSLVRCAKLRVRTG